MLNHLVKLQFQTWCKDTIVSSYGEASPRHTILAQFCKDIVVFLKRQGYNLHVGEGLLGDEIATGLFMGQFPQIMRNIEWHPDDYDYWNYKISLEDWGGFFDYWQTKLLELEDYTVQACIQGYLWRQLNIPDSASGKFIERLILGDEGESESDVENRVLEDDPYLKDQKISPY
jgi:hypothetical protein